MGDVSVSIYTELQFDEIIYMPFTFNDDILNDKNVFGYEEEYEVFNYNIDIHKVSVSNPGYVYILKDSENGRAYKIQFIEYISGVTVFKYNSICEDC